MAKMGVNDRIRVTISRERNSNLIHNQKVVIEMRNNTRGKTSKDVSWHSTLQLAVDHAAARMTSLNLYHATGVVPTLSDNLAEKAGMVGGKKN